MQRLTEHDVIFHSLGLHERDRQRPLKSWDTLGRVALHSQGGGEMSPTLIYMPTVSQHFMAKGGEYSKEIANNNTHQCMNAIDKNARAAQELDTIKPGVNTHYVLHGNDTQLGNLHVGGGDCTHYCMPGHPDVLAEKLLMLIAKKERRKSG
jgi:hypothetical protein